MRNGHQLVDKVIDKLAQAVEKDAEGAIWVSSAYKGTAETQIATKKSHLIAKSAENSADF